MSDLDRQLAALSVEQRAELARLLRERQQASATIPRRSPPTDVAPSSWMQRGLWLLDQLQPGPAYNLVSSTRLRGRLDVEVLERALNEVIRRHEMLRTTFHSEDGEPIQRIAPALYVPVTVVDLTMLSPEAREAELEARTARTARRPFDLARGPLVRATLVQLQDDEWRFVLALHHTICDAWSLGLLFREIQALYAAFTRGQQSPLTELPIQYGDFAAWQRSERNRPARERDLEYWTRQLTGVTPTELPTDFPRPSVQRFRGAKLAFQVPASTVERLVALSRRDGATLYMVLLAAFQTLLHRYTSQDDVVIGSVIADRRQSQTHGLIGFFLNTLVARVDMSDDPTFRDLLHRVRRVALEAFEHQDAPFDHVVNALHPVRDPSRNPLFQILFTFQDAPAGAPDLPGLRTESEFVETGTSQLDLSLVLEQGPDAIDGQLQYDTDLFEAATIERLVGHLVVLLDGIAADPDRRLSELPLLTPTERHQIVEEWNRTARPYPTDRTLSDLFAEQVARAPEAVAVIWDDGRLTYRELDERANRLAHELEGLGVGPDRLVGVYLERSPELVVAVLAILKAGGAYVPLDPAYPSERLRWMAEDAGLTVLVSRTGLVERLTGHQAAVICLDRDAERIAAAPASSPVSGATADDLAYVIYTSGSTGRPKGVMVPHGAVVNTLLWLQEAFPLTTVDTIAQKTASSFTDSVWELFWPLVAGSKLAILSDEAVRDPELLYRALAEQRITVTQFVPPQLRAFLDWLSAVNVADPLPKLRWIFNGGEALPPRLAQAWYARFRQARIANIYGMTESAIYGTWAVVEPAPDGGEPRVLVGKPIGNASAYVLDRWGQPCPPGVPGEIHLGGRGLARGYLNQPELTAEVFITDPFSTVAGARLYKTGDVGRYLSDGSIDYLGRSDQQVKIRGFRVEPGEIEATLRAQPGVAEAVAVVREDRPGDPRLVAYIVGADGTTVPAARELRASLEERLPEYMVPGAFVRLDALPLTPSGKLDRRALPAPSADGFATVSAYVAPRTPTETVLAGLWASVLGVERVGILDDFFALGGHSLLATRVLARVRATFGVELPLRAAFEARTVTALAGRIDQARAAAGGGDEVPLVRVSRDRPQPLSYAQQRLWVLDRLDGGGPRYNIPLALRLRGPLDRAALDTAVRQLAARHEALRSAFVERDGQAHQVIAAEPTLAVTHQDLRGVASAGRETAIVERLETEALRPFDLAVGPLLRVALLQLADDDYVLALTVHHIVADGWSLGVIWRDLAALYSATVSGRAADLSPLPIQCVDYAAWQCAWLDGPRLDRQLEYWRARLSDAPARLELPTDRPRPAVQGAEGSAVSFRLGAEMTGALRRLAAEQEATLYMVLLAAFQTLLHRYTGQDDLLVGVPIAGRPRPELEGLIGLFINTLVLRADLSGDPSFREFLARTREAALDADAHQDLPFERLVTELDLERDLSHHPLVQVLFALQNMPFSTPELSGLVAEEHETDIAFAKLDLSIGFQELDEGMRGRIEYDATLFDRDRIERMVEHLRVLLEGIAADPDRRLSELPLLSDAERHLVVEAWNQTERPYRAHETLPSLFAQQVARTPEAVAVSFENSALTYRELDTRANQLAHHLRALGVGPETLVAICAERSLELVVGLVGILKAGGAYVPLDPTYPAERLAFMLTDAQAPVLLTQQALVSRLPNAQEGGTQVVCLDADWPTIARCASSPVESGVGPSNLAYSIYTSGSTGQPKGALNTHLGIVNRLLWMQEAYNLGPDDRVLQKTPYSFDVSVWEFFWPLLTGARLVMARPDGHRDTAYLVQAIDEQGVTVLHFVPSMLRSFLEDPGLDTVRSLRLIVCSGEALSPDLRDRCLTLFPQAQLENLYGPTEAAVDVTAWPCNDDLGRPTSPIGRPIANTRVYVLDPARRPVPIGVDGELYLGGVQVARGYHRRPDLTAERFLPDPFSSEPGAQLYRTGDRVRWRADGVLEYLGRLDSQVKLRGFRIELGEIEAALRAHAGVADTAVVVHEHAPGDDRLAAYIVPDAAAAAPVRALVGLERAGELGGRRLHGLPNGLQVAYANPGETDFLYRELFEDAAYLRNGITLGERACVFDVGANIGLFGVAVAQVCPDARVYAFEPFAELAHLAQINARLHNVDARVFQCALGGSTGQATFTYYPHLSILSGRYADAGEERETVRTFLEASGASAGADLDDLLSDRLRAETVVCSIRTLSDVIAEHEVEQIDLLKIDVEKSELDVLAGLAEADWPKILQIVVEVHDVDRRVAYVTGLLERHGFAVVAEADPVLKGAGLFTLYGRRPSAQTTASRARPRPAATYRRATELVSALRDDLRDKLPEYLVPSSFTLLDSLPLTPNGKLDRQALPAPSVNGLVAESVYVAPRTPTETLLAGIWTSVLSLERVGIRDSFFDLGGHSLLATRMLSRVRAAFGVELPLRAAFEARTVAALAGRVDSARAAALGVDNVPLAPVSRATLPAASYSQQRLWVLDHLDGGSPRYNVLLDVSLRGHLDRAALVSALRDLVARHETLRTTFVEQDGRAYQRIDPDVRVAAVWRDLRAVPPADRETTLARTLSEEALRPFDLATGPLLRVMVLQLDDQEHVLALTIHHVIADGWSLGVLWRDLAALYAAAVAGQAAELPSLPIQYADYAAWQHAWLDGARLDRQLAYWRNQLADAPTRLELPTDRPRPAIQGSEGGAVSLRLGAELTRALRRLAAEHEATLYMVLLAAFQTLLHRYTSQDDLLVGAPIAGRPRPELEGLIGLFINTLVLRADLSGDPSFREFLARTREAALDADAHQDLPFERLVTELDLERDLSHHPLVQVLFTLQNVPFAPPELPGLTTEELEPDIAFAKVDLSLHMQELGDGMRGRIEYDVALFDRSRIARMAEHLRVLLGGIAADPDQRLSQLPLLPQAERQVVVEAWNQTSRSYPAERSIPELFAEQVQRTPDAVAVELGDARLTYRALDARANQLAHRLRALGVRSGRVVGIQAKRSVELVAGLLGILKAGGAYLPLDPTYPAERLAFMLADARADVLLVDAAAPALASSEDVRRLLLDPSWTSFEGELETAPTPAAGGADPAYVMYTSGSTGTPKGVVVPHRAIARLVVNTDYVTLRPDDVVAQASNVSFDAATFEIWGALLSGARLTIVERDDLLSTAALASAIEQRGITTLFLTTALFNELARSSPPALRGLRQLLFGGEAVDPRWVRRMLAEAPPAQLLHVYGPTETTTFATWHLVEAVPADATTVPIGRPIANTTTYVLDPQGRPVPIGVPGELYIGGPGVALGYLDRPELTAEKFVADPSSDNADARLYRTGDLVRYRADGAIEFLGRLDQQVKIRGFRIEPGEIEAALTEHPEVRDAVVMARDDGGDRRLVAYVVPEREDPSVAELRGFVGQRLPDYMVPSAFVLLESLPLTANGKLDRDALPPPEAARPDLGDGFVAPRTPTEATLADIWARVLGIEDVGVHDNFFDLGGDSILGMQVVARARQAGLDISASHLFQHDTIAELAPLVDVAHVSPTVSVTADAPLVTLDERQLDRILTRVSEHQEPQA